MTSLQHIEPRSAEGHEPRAINAAMLTIEEAARHLNVSKATVKRAILRGHLKAADLTERCAGGRHRPNYRIRLEWIHEYVQSRLAPVPPPAQRRLPRTTSSSERDYLK